MIDYIACLKHFRVHVCQHAWNKDLAFSFMSIKIVSITIVTRPALVLFLWDYEISSYDVNGPFDAQLIS